MAVLPGIPVDIQPVDRGFAVACINESSICLVDWGPVTEVLPYRVLEPRRLCLWHGELLVTDFAGESIVLSSGRIPLPGNPDGMCELSWSSPSASELAVALFNPGMVLLVGQDSTVSMLVEMAGVKSLSPCDADGDGDTDIFASGCGSGVIYIENRESLPVVHHVGSIQVGVKRCCAIDMDDDGLVDVAGIACAEGGAGWWKNPGDPDRQWIYHEIDGSLKGPKGICCRGDSMVIASLFSSTFFSFDPELHLPEGFTCCFITEDGDVLLGHRFGFLIRMPDNGD